MKIPHSSFSQFVQGKEKIEINIDDVDCLALLWLVAQCEARRIAISHKLDLTPLRARQRARLCLYHDHYIVVVFQDLSIRVLTFKDSDTSDLYPYTDTVIRHPYLAVSALFKSRQALLLLALADHLTLDDRPFNTPFPLWKIERYRLYLTQFGPVDPPSRFPPIEELYAYLTGQTPYRYNEFEQIVQYRDKTIEGSHSLYWFKYLTDGGVVEDAPSSDVEPHYAIFVAWCLSALENRRRMTKSIHVFTSNSKEKKGELAKRTDLAYFPWHAPIGFKPNDIKEIPIGPGTLACSVILDVTDPHISLDLRGALNPSLKITERPLLWPGGTTTTMTLDPFYGLYRLQYLPSAPLFVKLISYHSVIWFDTRALLQYWKRNRDENTQLTDLEQRNLLNMLVPLTPDLFWGARGTNRHYQVIQDLGEFTIYARFLAGRLAGNSFVRS